jgi:hypothetical protein
MTRTYPLLVVALLTACGGDAPKEGSSNMQAESGCASADSTAVELAVLDYITNANPKPQRFLHASGTDSAVTDEALKVLQDKGPTFFYVGSEEAKKKLRDKLEYDGPFPSMLVVMPSRQVSADSSTETITIGGHYVANQLNGTASPPRTFSFRCDSSKWVRTDQMPSASR